MLLGFGFTCQTGAVDAWMVDALDATGYSGSKDRIFARTGIFTGISMLIGTLGGGLLGQLNLAIPYLVRTGLLVGVFVVTFVFMHEIGFTPRALRFSRFGEESRNIFEAGIRHGWRHPVVRPLLFTSLVSGLLLWYLFYAAQPYALELLGQENLVWVAGAVTALFALSGVAGNMLVGRISKTRLGKRPARAPGPGLRRTGDLPRSASGSPGLVSGRREHRRLRRARRAADGRFGILDGILRPVRQAYINENIPSAQRATVLSFDSFFGDIGAVVGQVGLGYAAQTALQGRGLHHRWGDLLHQRPALPARGPGVGPAGRARRRRPRAADAGRTSSPGSPG